jgi:hypothetical protein
MSRLLGSVGDGGRNFPSDVKAVQYLLSVRGMNPGKIDNICGKKTIAAIERFQYGFMSNPDGVVDVDGQTWRRLAGQSHTPPPKRAAPPAPPTARKPTTPRPPATPRAPTPPPSTARGSITQLIAVPSGSVNAGLTSVRNAYMFEKFGAPRTDGKYTVDGGPTNNPRLQRAMVTRNVGPFRVTGLGPAVASLTSVFTEVRRDFPEVHAAITSGGMFNCRYVRGSKTSISNHSWGTAIDLGFYGAVDPWRDNKVYFGLAQIAPIFNRHGWFWGATFRREDGMHFEGSKSLIDSWASQV